MRILSDTFFCLSILLLTSALPDCSWAQVLTVALNPLNVEIEAVNDEFSVDVTISDVVDLHGAATVVQFDPLILEAVSVVKGEFLGSGGQSTFSWSDFDNMEGWVQYEEAILGAYAVSGSGVLDRITFRALRLGQSDLAFSAVDLRDLDNAVLPAESTEGRVSVGLLIGALPDFSPVQTSTVSVHLPDLVLEAANDVFTVDVTIRDAVDLHGASIVVQFDPLILEIVGVVKGEFLGSGGQSTFFWSDFDNSEGRVQCDEAILGPHKVSGSGVLHRITFKALRLGETGLAFGTVDLRDLDNVTLPAKSTDGHVAIGSVYVDDEVSTTSPLPEEYFLVQNSPNPFNAQTTIRYGVPTASGVHLVVYNVMGQAVRVLADHHQEAGRHRVMWDGTDDLGRDVRSGTYVLKMRAGDFVDSCKMLLLK